MDDFFGKMRELYDGLPIARKFSMGLILVLTVSVVAYMVHVSNMASMEPLFTKLNSEDIGSIVSRLDKQGVRYTIDQDQRTILVPSTDVLDLRMKFAEEGLPRFGGIGFEIFDRNGFGMSDFEQRVSYQRALEGELTRTVTGIREIESARVHLVLPEKSLFANNEKSASASVIVKLGGSGQLSQSAVRAITHLVASAVEGLGSDQVTIIDSQGRLLTSEEGGTGVAASGRAFEQQGQIEREYERRIVSLLAPVVGFGKVIARVTAEVDFTQMESTEEFVDPTKSAVLSESRTNSKRTESANGSGGAAGATSNGPGGGAGGAGTGNSGSADESSEEISYAVSKTVRRQVSPSGGVKKLSIAVLVDGTYSAPVEDAEGEDAKPVYSPRTAEQLQQFQEIVKNAIGFSTDRGDQIKIENLEFQSPEQQLAKAEEWYQERTTYGFIVSVVGNVLVVLMGILVILFVVRPLVRQWNAGNQQLLDGEVSADVGQLVRTDPVAAANAIRQWIK